MSNGTSESLRPVDAVAILIGSLALTLVLLWLATRLTGRAELETLPTWIVSGAQQTWSWITAAGTAGGASLLIWTLRGKVSGTHYLLGILGVTITMLVLVVGLTRALTVSPKDNGSPAPTPATTEAPVSRVEPNLILSKVLTPRGFPHAHNERRQVPGCGCGPTDMTLDPVSITARVGEGLSFKWDAAWICQGQRLRDPMGTIWWDGQTAEPLPDSYGSAQVTFGRRGSYPVRLHFSARCLDENNGGATYWPVGNYCEARGTITVNVE